MTSAGTACLICQGEGSVVDYIYNDVGDRKAVVVAPCPRCSTETARPFEAWRPLPKWKMAESKT